MNHVEHAQKVEELLYEIEKYPGKREFLLPEAQVHATMAVYDLMNNAPVIQSIHIHGDGTPA